MQIDGSDAEKAGHWETTAWQNIDANAAAATLTGSAGSSANYTRIWSEVPFTDPLDGQDKLRTMHGRAKEQDPA